MPKNALPSHSDVKGSGHLHLLRRVFSLSVKLILSMRDTSIVEVVLIVMGYDEYGEVAERLIDTNVTSTVVFEHGCKLSRSQEVCILFCNDLRFFLLTHFLYL